MKTSIPIAALSLFTAREGKAAAKLAHLKG